MKIAVSTSSFLSALEFVGAVVSKEATIPTLTNVWMRANGGKLAVSGTDLELAASAELDIDSQESDGFMASGVKVLGFARMSKTDTINISAGKSWATISSGKASIRVQTQSGEFSDVPEIAETGAGVTLPDGWMSRIANFTHSLAVVGDKPDRQAARYEYDGKAHCLQVYDGKRLLVFEKDGEGCGQSVSFTIPPKLLRLLGRIDGKATVEAETRRIVVRLPGKSLQSRVLYFSVPDHRGGAAKAFKPKAAATIESQDLALALNRARLLMPAEQTGVRISSEGGALYVRQHPSWTEEFEDSVPCDGDSGIDFLMNSRFIQEWCQFAGKRKTTIRFGGPLAGVGFSLAEPEAGERVEYFAMPLYPPGGVKAA